MNPLTRLYRRSRVYRLLCYFLTLPLWGFIGYISFNSFGKYSEVGDVTILALVMFFALWAWWYDEDRDRRRALKAEQADNDGRPPTTA